MEPVRLNVRQGSIPRACYSCRPTSAHYRDMGMKIVNNLLDQKIIDYCRNSRSEWCVLTHFVKNPGRVDFLT